MASLFAHTAVAYAIGKIHFRKTQPARFWAAGIFCAVLPDVDVVAFALGIPYGHFWGHRGFTHSFFFAAILGALFTVGFSSREKENTVGSFLLFIYFFLCTASHGVLDALTNGGLGVAFFSPFENARYFFPWQPIQVSPIGIASFFSQWGLQVILSEIVWLGIPCLMLLLVLKIYRQKQKL